MFCGVLYDKKGTFFVPSGPFQIGLFCCLMPLFTWICYIAARKGELMEFTNRNGSLFGSNVVAMEIGTQIPIEFCACNTEVSRNICCQGEEPCMIGQDSCWPCGDAVCQRIQNGRWPIPICTKCMPEKSDDRQLCLSFSENAVSGFSFYRSFCSFINRIRQVGSTIYQYCHLPWN